MLGVSSAKSSAWPCSHTGDSGTAPPYHIQSADATKVTSCACRHEDTGCMEMLPPIASGRLNIVNVNRDIYSLYSMYKWSEIFLKTPSVKGSTVNLLILVCKMVR